MEEDYDLDEEGNWSYESYGSEVYEEDEIQQMGTSTAQLHQPSHHPLHLLSPYNIQLGGSETKVEEITETPPGFELTEENSVCKICYKNAINSVLCTTQKCKILMCESCVTETVKKNENKCPFCRSSPFSVVVNPIRQLINKIQLTCKLCEQKYILQEEQKHYKIKCAYFHRIKCNYCELEMNKEEVVKHTRLAHEDKIDEIIFDLYANPPGLFDPKKVINKRLDYFKLIGKSAQLGTTGKFYCGGKLDVMKCTCCNGSCGPGNGCNCSECMKLDLLRLGIPKGYLVNSQGRVCWKQGHNFVCKARISYGSQSCTDGTPCRSCNNITKYIERYRDLLL